MKTKPSTYTAEPRICLYLNQVWWIYLRESSCAVVRVMWYCRVGCQTLVYSQIPCLCTVTVYGGLTDDIQKVCLQLISKHYTKDITRHQNTPNLISVYCRICEWNVFSPLSIYPKLFSKLAGIPPMQPSINTGLPKHPNLTLMTSVKSSNVNGK